VLEHPAGQINPMHVGDTIMTQPAVDRSSSTQDWRTRYPVHPCADVFPMLPDDELDALAADIKTHGLKNPIVLWRDLGAGKGRREYLLLDGRNRLEAFQRAGIAIPAEPTDDTPLQFMTVTGDPAAYVISANIRRRHLTKEQQAELIVRTVEAAQELEAAQALTTEIRDGAAKNDQAKVARSFNPTPGKRGGSTKDPVLHKSITEAKKHGISARTVKRARAKVQGKTPAPKKERLDTRPPTQAERVRAGFAKPTPTKTPTRAVDRASEQAAGAILLCLRTCLSQGIKKPIILDAAKRIFVLDPQSDWCWDDQREQKVSA
jgi:hypothetical protein